MAVNNALRLEFLKKFTKGLILNSRNIKDLTSKKDSNIKEIVDKVDIINKPLIKIEELPKKREIVETFPSSVEKSSVVEKPIQSSETKENDLKNKAEESIIKDFETGQKDSMSLGKISSLIHDQNVQTIECPGPNKYILVQVRGRTQATKVILTKDEIKKIIDDFADKTRIPLIGGTFKAAYGDLIMTAVISDFIGSRFVIHKKGKFKNLRALGTKSSK